jgi:hypothetical protein
VGSFFGSVGNAISSYVLDPIVNFGSGLAHGFGGGSGGGASGARRGYSAGASVGGAISGAAQRGGAAVAAPFQAAGSLIGAAIGGTSQGARIENGAVTIDGTRVATVGGGSPEDQQSVLEAARDVLNTDRGSELGRQLVDRGQAWGIALNDRDKIETRAGTADRAPFTRLDPNSSRSVWVAGWPPVQNSSIARRVAHELGHAVTGIGDTGFLGRANIIANENPIMTQLGEPPRLWY